MERFGHDIHAFLKKASVAVFGYEFSTRFRDRTRSLSREREREREREPRVRPFSQQRALNPLQNLNDSNKSRTPLKNRLRVELRLNYARRAAAYTPLGVLFLKKEKNSGIYGTFPDIPPRGDFSDPSSTRTLSSKGLYSMWALEQSTNSRPAPKAQSLRHQSPPAL